MLFVKKKNLKINKKILPSYANFIEQLNPNTQTHTHTHTHTHSYTHTYTHIYIYIYIYIYINIYIFIVYYYICICVCGCLCLKRLNRKQLPWVFRHTAALIIFWSLLKNTDARVLLLVKVRFRQNRLAGSVQISVNNWSKCFKVFTLHNKPCSKPIHRLCWTCWINFLQSRVVFITNWWKNYKV